MSDDTKDLVRMANQIGAFFGAYPEDEAKAGIAGHIKEFWTAAMRAKFDAHIAAGGEGVSPLVLAALAESKQAA
ncbi:formate dehydrogenase subunit delta [Rhodospirillaceae bacterium KN72]|uniref:Formate dehydrogenase subunit delta n=1 Tax=Pacificispira spongiicola TaxID=2729598 RepID=A0A7Y0E3T9_9PROT|nr:formate dehydrogenase subunit delta [Pacificispira spongiicola]NMM46679.1 formate dehydrogenase subunit delta [Pacificispira spongiicola]